MDTGGIPEHRKNETIEHLKPSAEGVSEARGNKEFPHCRRRAHRCSLPPKVRKKIAVGCQGHAQKNTTRRVEIFLSVAKQPLDRQAKQFFIFQEQQRAPEA